VRIGERAAEGIRDPLDLGGGYRALLGHPFRQGATGQVRHHEGDLVAVVDDLEQLDDVGVVQPGQHLGFPLDALAGSRHLVGRSLQRQALEGHLGAVVPAPEVDHPHAPAPEAGHPLVAHVTRVGSGGGDWSSQGAGIVAAMTETEDVTRHDAVIDEALRLIDSGLSDLMHRELVSTDEVSDLLLDVRMLLTAAELAAEAGTVPAEPVGAS
jgi:hypothetical protein